MAVSFIPTSIPPALYATVAFQLVNNLAVQLVKSGALTAGQRTDMFRMVALGLQPATDPMIKAMRDLLMNMANTSPEPTSRPH